jgi:hypothetical protein
MLFHRRLERPSACQLTCSEFLSQSRLAGPKRLLLLAQGIPKLRPLGERRFSFRERRPLFIKLRAETRLSLQLRGLKAFQARDPAGFKIGLPRRPPSLEPGPLLMPQLRTLAGGHGTSGGPGCGPVRTPCRDHAHNDGHDTKHDNPCAPHLQPRFPRNSLPSKPLSAQAGRALAPDTGYPFPKGVKRITARPLPHGSGLMARRSRFDPANRRCQRQRPCEACNVATDVGTGTGFAVPVLRSRHAVRVGFHPALRSLRATSTRPSLFPRRT